MKMTPLRLTWTAFVFAMLSCLWFVSTLAYAQMADAPPDTGATINQIVAALNGGNGIEWVMLVAGVGVLVIGLLRTYVLGHVPFFRTDLGGWIVNVLFQVSAVFSAALASGKSITWHQLGVLAVGAVSSAGVWQGVKRFIGFLDQHGILPTSIKLMLGVIGLYVPGKTAPISAWKKSVAPLALLLLLVGGRADAQAGPPKPAQYSVPNDGTDFDLPIGSHGFVLHGTYTLIGPGGFAYDFDGSKRSLAGGASVGVALFHVPIAGQPFDLGVAAATLTDSGGTPIVGAQLTILTFAYLGYGLTLLDANGNINPFAGSRHGSMIYGGWMVPIDTIVGLIIKLSNGTAAMSGSLLR